MPDAASLPLVTGPCSGCPDRLRNRRWIEHGGGHVLSAARPRTIHWLVELPGRLFSGGRLVSTRALLVDMEGVNVGARCVGH